MVCTSFPPVHKALGGNIALVGVKNSSGAWARRGVVALACSVTGRAWIAGTNNPEHCYRNLSKRLAEGSHSDRELQRDYTEHGAKSFSFELLEFVLSTDSIQEATTRQQAKYNGRLYNPAHRPRSK